MRTRICATWRVPLALSDHTLTLMRLKLLLRIKRQSSALWVRRYSCKPEGAVEAWVDRRICSSAHIAVGRNYRRGGGAKSSKSSFRAHIRAVLLGRDRQPRFTVPE